MLKNLFRKNHYPLKKVLRPLISGLFWGEGHLLLLLLLGENKAILINFPTVLACGEGSNWLSRSVSVDFHWGGHKVVLENNSKIAHGHRV